MKATEMRIGNWAMGNKPFQLSANDIMLAAGHEQVKNGEERWESIPLTEEWLIKFGFKKASEKCFRLGRLKYMKAQLKKGGTGYYTFFSYGSVIFTHISHVHQLQNLYHTITGEELTFIN